MARSEKIEKHTHTKPPVFTTVSAHVMLGGTRKISAFAVACLMTSGLAACGGGTSHQTVTQSSDAAGSSTAETASGASGEVVARVGATTITKTTLDQWMSAMVGGDYYEKNIEVAPKGLISTPPQYASCTLAVKALAVKLRHEQSKLSATALKGKCQLLNHVIQQQALVYLISSQQNIALGAELGVTVTPAEVQGQLQASRYPRILTEAEFHEYLVNRGWTLAQFKHLVKQDVLSETLRAKLVNEPQLLARARAERKKWIARTNCQPEYVVEGCRQYTPATQAGPDPSDVIGEIRLGV
jgi:hypothetical protein